MCEIEEVFGLIFIGVILGVFTTLLIWDAQDGDYHGSFGLSKETLNEICYNFTNTKGVEGISYNGNLVCSLPTFDSTSKIIIKSNGEKDNE
jgi:hypothetical protein